MTEQFNILVKEANSFLSSSKYSPLKFFEFVDKIWFEHELDFEYDNKGIGNVNSQSEHTIASDILELVDRYDSCDEIVKNDPYCINEKQLRELLKDILEKYGLRIG